MFHSVITAAAVTSAPHLLDIALPGDRLRAGPSARGLHAQTLAYAARRRRAAQVAGAASCGDRAYWKAAVPAALAKAASIRTETRFVRLP